VKSTSKPSYADYLAKLLSDDEIAIAQKLLTDKLLNKTVNWKSATAIIYIHNK